MTVYEIAIAVVDEPEAKRKKQGDIVAVRPAPFNWGRKEIDALLIVLADLPDTINGISTQHVLESGIFEGDKTIFDIKAEMDALPDDDPHIPPDVKEKNAFRIPLSKIYEKVRDIDSKRVEDKGRVYQPFKAKDQLLSKFDGKHGRRTIDFDLEDDTKTRSIGSNDTYVFSASDLRDLIFSKKENDFLDLSGTIKEK